MRETKRDKHRQSVESCAQLFDLLHDAHKLVKELREAVGLSVHATAKAAHITTITLQRIENRHNCRVDVLGSVIIALLAEARRQGLFN